MTVEKFIRILGYIIYTALWSPVIIIGLIVLPIWSMIMFKSVTVGLKMCKRWLEVGINHDMEFIRTGVWY